MTTLNKRAADVLRRFGGAVHGCTDVTGFGLIGHATEMAVASGVTIAIDDLAPADLRRRAGDCRREPIRRPRHEPPAVRADDDE